MILMLKPEDMVLEQDGSTGCDAACAANVALAQNTVEPPLAVSPPTSLVLGEGPALSPRAEDAPFENQASGAGPTSIPITILAQSGAAPSSGGSLSASAGASAPSAPHVVPMPTATELSCDTRPIGANDEPMVEFRHTRSAAAELPFLPRANRRPMRAPHTSLSDTREMGARRVERSRWLLAGLSVLAQSSARDLALQGLCTAVGGTAPGFLLHFKSMDHYRRELVTLWEQAAISSVSADTAGNRNAREGVLADLLDTAFEAEEPLVERHDIDAHRLDAAIRAWARESEEVAEVVARVDRARIYALALLMSHTGLEFGAARDRAEVFYAACLGFETLNLGTGNASPRPGLRALAAALLGPKDQGRAINAVESEEP